MVGPPLILVVDDDASVRKSAVNLLEALGFRAVAYAKPDDLLQSELLPETACLILDVRLPGITGIELQQKLREHGMQIPMIFLTAHTADHTRTAALDAGAIDYLFKPVTAEALRESIERALNQDQQRDFKKCI